jgi:hypothetical protein
LFSYSFPGTSRPAGKRKISVENLGKAQFSPKDAGNEENFLHKSTGDDAVDLFSAFLP